MRSFAIKNRTPQVVHRDGGTHHFARSTLDSGVLAIGQIVLWPDLHGRDGHATGRLTTGNHTLHGFDRFGSSYALSLTKRTLAHFRSLRSAAGSSRIDSSQAEGLYISQVMD